MDKKMRKVTRQMEKAEKNFKKGNAKRALKQLDVAEAKNRKLANYDERVRDPEIRAYKRIKKKNKKSSR